MSSGKCEHPEHATWSKYCESDMQNIERYVFSRPDESEPIAINYCVFCVLYSTSHAENDTTTMPPNWCIVNCALCGSMMGDAWVCDYDSGQQYCRFCFSDALMDEVYHSRATQRFPGGPYLDNTYSDATLFEHPARAFFRAPPSMLTGTGSEAHRVQVKMASKNYQESHPELPDLESLKLVY